MRNLHLFGIVGGAAAVGLIAGNLLSRSPAPSQQSEATQQQARAPQRRPAAATASRRKARARAAERSQPTNRPAKRPAKRSPRAGKPAASERRQVDIHPEDPAKGSASARVTIAAFNDFQ
jgi:hypothetical protein